MKEKETYGVKLGDKITCWWEDEHTGKQRQQTGIVIDIDHDDPTSGESAMFHLGNKRGEAFWYYGNDITIHNP